MRARVVGVALAGGLLGFVTAGSLAAGGVVVVRIADLVFAPATVTAKVGDTVEWVNADFLDHTATAKDESFDLSLAVGHSGRLALTKPGRISYFCRVHPNMTGTIDVE